MPPPLSIRRLKATAPKQETSNVRQQGPHGIPHHQHDDRMRGQPAIPPGSSKRYCPARWTKRTNQGAGHDCFASRLVSTQPRRLFMNIGKKFISFPATSSSEMTSREPVARSLARTPTPFDRRASTMVRSSQTMAVCFLRFITSIHNRVKLRSVITSQDRSFPPARAHLKDQVPAWYGLSGLQTVNLINR